MFATAAQLGFAPSTTQLLPAFATSAARLSMAPSMLLDAGTASWLADAVLLPDSAAGAAATAATAAAEEPGLFEYVFVKPFEACITGIHGGLASVGIAQAWGPSIILFTLVLKAATFPLTKQQIESTSKMQAIQPAAKQLQEKYRNKDPARLNLELQKLYADNQVNPLAGCLPSFAQIPIFIGLYRSVLQLAKEDQLTEGFLWLPSLEGPVSDYNQGVGWLFGDAAAGYAWNGLTPPLGWSDTLAYLTLPVLLVISQYVSTSILTPKSDDPNMQQTQAILKFLPLMIGWFSLNVPSGLGLYWMTNNVVTTASTVLIKRSVGTPDLIGDGGTAASVAAAPPKPQGFGRKNGEVITKTDADTGSTVTISPPGTRKERRAAAAAVAGGTVIEAAVVSEVAAAPAAVEGVVTPTEADTGMEAAEPPSLKKKKKSKKTKKK